MRALVLCCILSKKSAFYSQNGDIFAVPQNFKGLFEGQEMVLRLKLELGLGLGQGVSCNGSG